MYNIKQTETVFRNSLPDDINLSTGIQSVMTEDLWRKSMSDTSCLLIDATFCLTFHIMATRVVMVESRSISLNIAVAT